MTETTPTDAETLRRIAERIAEGLSTPASSAPPQSHRLTAEAQHLAKLAHELKTPLSAIVAAAEVMRDERFGPLGDERYRGYASGIHDGALHALAVVSAILGQPTREGSETPVSFAEIDLNAIAGQVASSLAALMEASGLSIELDTAPRLPHVIADAMTVRQMLLNLATNAMRATPAGGSVLIRTAYDLAGPVHVLVTDTGAGMSQVDIARALDTARPSDYEQRPSGGLGLGYPLVHRLAEANGATISIDSAPGLGTTVKITFAAGRVVPV